MATTYYTSAFYDAAVAFPTSGIHLVRVKHTLTAALDESADDILKVCKLPKGAAIVQELCSVFATTDPGTSCVMALKLTDGTTTKDIIADTLFDSDEVRITPDAADYAALGFFKTSNDDFYVYLKPNTADVDTATVIYTTVAYTMDTGRYEVTT